MQQLAKKLAIVFDEADYADANCSLSNIVSDIRSLFPDDFKSETSISPCTETSSEKGLLTIETESAGIIAIEILHESLWNEFNSDAKDKEFVKIIPYDAEKLSKQISIGVNMIAVMVDRPPITQRLFVINGYPGAGKDHLIKTIASKCTDVAVHTLSTVDKVKQALTVFGYTEENKEAFRAVLSDVKDSVDKNLDNWTLKNVVKRACIISDNSYMQQDRSTAVFIHSRTPEDIDYIKEEIESAGFAISTIYIDADFYERDQFSNHADSNVENYNYDIVFNNTKNQELFNSNVDAFIEQHVTNLK